jgi:hypothetical protein
MVPLPSWETTTGWANMGSERRGGGDKSISMIEMWKKRRQRIGQPW